MNILKRLSAAISTVTGRDRIKEAVQRDPTKDYEAPPPTYFSTETIVNKMPVYRHYTGDLMLSSDPIVEFALNIRNAALMQADVEIKCKRPDVQIWLEKNWGTLWNDNRATMVQSKKWGFSALQVIGEEDNRGLLNVRRVKDFHPWDSVCIRKCGEIVGAAIKANSGSGPLRMHAPQVIWQTFNGRYGNPYGNGLLRRMYPPWFEKWMERGAKNLGRQRMVRDAYRGDYFEYPYAQTITDHTGKQIPWRDIIRGLSESIMSGAAITMPVLQDDKGNNLVKYTPPQNIAVGDHIFEWEERLDKQIFRGADVPLEVVEAQENGGFSGRSIPLMVLVAVAQLEFNEIVRSAVEMCLRPYAWLNWGGDPEFEIKPKSLIESLAKDASGSSMGGSAVGSPQGQRPQEQPQQVSPKRESAVQFSNEAMHAPAGGVTIHGKRYEGGEFIPSAVVDSLSEEDRGKLEMHGTRSGGNAADAGDEVEAFHGTSREFDEFDPDKAGENIDAGFFGAGTYFTSDPELGKYYARSGQGRKPDAKRKLHSAALKIQKPYDFGKRDKLSGTRGEAFGFGGQEGKGIPTKDGLRDAVYKRAGVKPLGADDDYDPVLEKKLSIALKEELLARGHDGAVATHPNGSKEYVAFKKGQAKIKKSEDVPLNDSSQFDLSNEDQHAIAEAAVKAAFERVKHASKFIRRQISGANLTDPAWQSALETSLRLATDGVGIELYGAMNTAGLWGASQVADMLPPVPPTTVLPPFEPPPLPPLTGFLDPDDQPTGVTFPILDEAIDRLRSSSVATASTWQETAEKAREGSFAITADLSDRAVERIRALLAETIQEGGGEDEFAVKVGRFFEEGPLSENHLRTIFRTNSAAAMSGGKQRVVESEHVADSFPYRRYYATSDQRTRPEHRALERLGLNGTPVYRADDPVWKEFQPIWAFGCRCEWAPYTVGQAARAGVTEAAEWIERAKAAAGGDDYHAFLADTAPSSPAWVDHPPFHADPEFKRQ